MSPPTIHHVKRLDLRLDGWRWPFADQRRAEIDAHFEMLRRAKPQLWNGGVLLARDPRIDNETFSARCFETDFASLIAWRDWGFPDESVINVFGMGALRGSDGGFILGEMGGHTANAGRVYFPSGTPDPTDVTGDILDIGRSVAREVAEETGLTPSDYAAADDWHCVAAGCLLAIIRVLDAPCPADGLRTRIEAYLQSQPAPELSAVNIVRSSADVTAAMPDFVAAFIAARNSHAA